MNYSTRCSHCGHQVTAYTLRMNQHLALAFVQFCKARIATGRAMRKGEIELENAAYSNFQNLRHFGIISQAERGSTWEVTPLGWLWLRGQVPIQNPAGHMAGVTLDETHPAWSTHAEPRQDLWIGDAVPANFDMRPYYQDQKVGAA